MDWITLGMWMLAVLAGGLAGLFHQGGSRKRTQAMFDAVDKSAKVAAESPSAPVTEVE